MMLKGMKTDGFSGWTNTKLTDTDLIWNDTWDVYKFNNTNIVPFNTFTTSVDKQMHTVR